MSRRTTPMTRWPTLGLVWRAALLLALGVLVTVAFSWGAIFWRVCVSRPLLNAGEGAQAETNQWPLPAPADWPSRPDYVQVTRGFAYERRIASGGLQLVRWSRDPGAEWVEARGPDYQRLAIAHAQEQALLRSGRLSADEARRLAAGRPLEYRLIRCEVFRRRSGFPFLCMESSWRDCTRHEYTQGAGGVTGVTPWSAALPTPDPDGKGWTPAMHYHRGIPWPQDLALPNAGGSRFNLPLKPVWPMFVLNVLAWAAGPAALLHWRRRRRTRRRVGRGQCPRCAYPIGVSGVCSECGTNLPIRANSYGSAAVSLGTPPTLPD